MSLPSPQPSLRVRVLRSGSAGNAIVVDAGTARFLIDAGLPAETILRELQSDGTPPALDAILLTHEHDDHLKGVAAVAKATGATVLANEGTRRAAGEQLMGVPVELFTTGRPFRIGRVEATAVPLPHDAAEPVGFVLSTRGWRVAVACDLGEITDALVEHARGADFLIIEANYDLRLMAVSAYPWFLKNRIIGAQGHLSNDGAAAAAVRMATGAAQTVHLVHLSEANNLAPLARDIVKAALAAEGLRDVGVEAVRPNAGGPWWTAPDARHPSAAAAPCPAVSASG
ncbi:MAG: MBL fold metallo-hydrolase [Armatimonadota bacterium]|nr:MBL fold metallo-hydrolase [Armatimonadota bacterium]